MDSNMEKANGKRMQVQHFVIVMRVTTIWTKRMVMEYSLGKVVIYLKGTIEMMREMAMVRCFGLMGLYIKVNGKMESSMVWVRWFFLMGLSKRDNLKIMPLKALLVTRMDLLWSVEVVK
jgi:hypothetical protein